MVGDGACGVPWCLACLLGGERALSLNCVMAGLAYAVIRVTWARFPADFVFMWMCVGRVGVVMAIGL